MLSNYSWALPDYAVFKGCKSPNTTSSYKSRSGSEYWYGEDNNGRFIIRKSCHWTKVIYKKIPPVGINECGFIVDKLWFLITNNNKSKIQCGKCYIDDLDKAKLFIREKLK